MTLSRVTIALLKHALTLPGLKPVADKPLTVSTGTPVAAPAATVSKPVPQVITPTNTPGGKLAPGRGPGGAP